MLLINQSFAGYKKCFRKNLGNLKKTLKQQRIAELNTFADKIGVQYT